MAIRRKIISEAQVMKIILDEFNDNDVGLNFSSSMWGTNEEGTEMSIIRRDFTNDRFDVREEFNEQTYAKVATKFIPTNIDGVNADILTHPEMQELSYSPQVQFLVNSDSETWLAGVRNIIESTRSRLMQYRKDFVIKHMDINTNETYEVVYKGVFSTGEMDYGSNVTINGKNYLMMSLQVNLFLTDYGDFANGQEFTFYHSDLKDTEGNLKPFKIPQLTWDYAMVIDDETSQTLRGTDDEDRDKPEVISYAKTKGFGITFTIPIDFRNEFLRELYINSMEVRDNIPYVYVDFRTFYNEYNEVTKEFERKEIVRARNKRAYIPPMNKPLEELSLGDKLYYSLSLTPSAKGWWEDEL